jgi:hypothetical protein
MPPNPDWHNIIRTDAGDFSSDAYIRYLAAKKSVDDRALNRYVWQKLKASLPPSTRRKPLRVIELGAGIGTMLERVVEWGLAPHLHYTIVEQNADYLAAFWSRCGSKGSGQPRTLQERQNERTKLATKHADCTVETVCADLYDVPTDPRRQGQYDLIIAHAVMDLVDAAEALPGFATMARPGGLLYLSLIYDGHTEFLPSGDLEFERELLDRYHLSMDQRVTDGRPSGGSRAARGTFAHLAALALPVLAVGGSDWIVYPQAGRYEAEEAYFLDMIIETIDRQLQQDTSMDSLRRTEWAAQRHGQVQAGELMLMARNMDFLVRRSAL